MELNATADSSATPTMNAAELALELFKLLSPYSPELRQRAVQAALAALGEPSGAQAQVPSGLAAAGLEDFGDLKLGPKALKWLQKNRISRAMLDEVFHVGDGHVEVTASSVPGISKREMTLACYLLAGVRGLLEVDTPTLEEKETVALCKRLTAYDKNNHPTHRSAVGNRMTGAKPTFTLTGPGENAAAELVKQIASNGLG